MKMQDTLKELMRVTQQQRIVISMSYHNIYIELTYVKLYVTLIVSIIDLMSCLQCRAVFKLFTLGILILHLNEKQSQNFF